MSGWGVGNAGRTRAVEVNALTSARFGLCSPISVEPRNWVGLPSRVTAESWRNSARHAAALRSSRNMTAAAHPVGALIIAQV